MKITGITKDQLEDLMCHWVKFGHCYKWTTPPTFEGRMREEKLHFRAVVFYAGDLEVDIRIKPECDDQYRCYRDLYLDGEKKAQGLKFLKKIFREGEW